MLVGFILLFIGGPDYYSSRIFKAIWDLGHVPFMFVVGVVVLELLDRAKYISQKVLPVAYSCIVIGIAFSSEYTQSFVGRTLSLWDVLADIVGGLLAWLFVFGLGRRQRLLTALTLFLCITVITPFFTIVYDEVVAISKFPLISDFENHSELSRWSGGELKRSTLRSTEGLYSLAFMLLDEGYSGVATRDFSPDWQGYRFLQFDVWSPKVNLFVTIRIHDKLHAESAQLYSDRFNRRYSLKQGWNRLTITLDDVYSAPKNRAFNLSEVWGLGLFSYNLGTQEKLYLDQLILIK